MNGLIKGIIIGNSFIAAVFITVLTVVILKRGSKQTLGKHIDKDLDSAKDAWTPILKNNAKVFIGLYNSMEKASLCKTKYPEKIIREWYTRAKHKWDGVYEQYTQHILPMIENGSDNVEYAKWASVIMEAAKAAGISKSGKDEFIITEENLAEWNDWNDSELSEGDRVKSVIPAWYQDGKLLETGFCEKI